MVLSNSRTENLHNTTYKGDRDKPNLTKGTSLNVYQRNIILLIVMLLVSMLVSLYFFNFDLVTTYLISINVTGFILLLYDKGIAGKGITRVPEKILHLVSFMGAWPSTTIGMLVFRHKVRKASFFVPHALIVIVEALAIVWWYL